MTISLERMSCIIAVGALIVSILSFLESQRQRKDQLKAFLCLELVQMDDTLYVVVHNIGNSYAYHVDIAVSKPFANRFSGLKLIRPAAVYRYSLMDSQSIREYPNEIEFTISYYDGYTKKVQEKIVSRFNLTDYVQYEVKYNSELNAYDINKTF